MSKVHYFQRYSQRENVATNNTLLLLSRLYAHDPSYLAAFLNDLVDTPEAIEVGPVFTQQRIYGGASIPDAVIEQKSFKLVVEAKRDGDTRLPQLKRQLDAFGNEEVKILVLLTPSHQSDAFKAELKQEVKRYNLQAKQKGREVVEVCTTFEEVIQSFGDILADHDLEMRELLEDYEEYCHEEGLLPRTGAWMRAVPCGTTIEDNKTLELYYQPATRFSREHEYLGIYKDKRVQYVGRIDKIVEVDLVDKELRARDIKLTPDEEERIRRAIHNARDEYGYDIASGYKFHLVEKLHETSFRKVSPGGLISQRYFDLVNELDLNSVRELPGVPDIARLLREKKWR